MNRNQRDEIYQANETLKLLESISADAATDGKMNGQNEMHELSQLLREAAQTDLPPVNPNLRKQLLKQLETQETQPANSGPIPSSEYPSAFSALRWAIAAVVMIGLGFWVLNQAQQQPIPVASVLKYQHFVPDGENPSSAPVPEPVIAESLPTLTLETGSGFVVPVDGEKGPAAKGFLPKKQSIQFGRKAPAYAPVNSVVTVPDGGTTLLGGIKSLGDNSRVQLGTEVNAVATAKYFSPNANTMFSATSQEQNWYQKSSEFYRYSTNGNLYAKNRPQITPDMNSWADKAALRKKYAEARFGFDEKLSTEQYATVQENTFYTTQPLTAVSTFSIDVDTASYSNLRRFITNHQLPPANAVRIEEMVNYFEYDYPEPKENEPFSVNMELASCPWNEGHKLLRVGLKGKDIHRDERPRTNIVFLLDVSGSMSSPDKLPLLKRGFQMMVDKLNENDSVSIVTYAGNAGCVLEPTSGDQKRKIKNALEALSSGGSTHGSQGIELAYKLAQQNFIKDGVNKVVLATDGDLNVGVTSDDALVKLITQKASEGVFLTVLGFGTGNLKDAKLEALADNGNGMYAYIDNIREAHKVLVEQMSGSLVTIAKDVKIQIEFNPAEVAAYRLIGYENRMLKTEDFDNDAKDAGEIGAGHTVTALYELVTTDQAETTAAAPTNLKYQGSNPAVEENLKTERQSAKQLTKAAQNGELLTLALRYKNPDENVSKRLEYTINNEEKSFSGASDDFRFATSVASFGLLLRGSKYAGNSNPGLVEEIASGAIGEDKAGYRAEFIDLVRRIKDLKR